MEKIKPFTAKVLRSCIYTRFSVIGFHQWVAAPAEVEYLQALHRHKFEIKVTCYVKEHDREIEFHMLQRKAKELMAELWHCQDGEYLFGGASCEHIATILGQALIDRDVPVMVIEVNEDGENGAIVQLGGVP